MNVKICGVTDPKTAACGAAYIGLVFSKRSPRCVTIEQAREIAKAARKAGAEPVGVFDEQGAEEIVSIAADLELKVVQLHGDNARAAYEALPEELTRIYAGSQPCLFNAARDFLLFDNAEPGSGKECDRSDFTPPPCRYFLAGGLKPETVQEVVARFAPYGVDVSSGVEERPGVKNLEKIKAFMQAAKPGRFGAFGGSYVPELLVQPLADLALAYREIGPIFHAELKDILRNYAGRPTPITEIVNFSKAIDGPRIFLKREDLLHTGAHKLNNAIGQCLLAKKCGKTRIIAETGAGQHGVATATACALFGLECVIYMGSVDVERQAPNVAKIRLLGAKIVSVSTGSATLKDAVNEALRDWAESYETSHYCLGSALGPHPFPSMVADFQSIIGQEAREQFQSRMGRHPDLAVACVGGGSNAIGLFSAYLNDPEVALVGVEAGGTGKGKNAARFAEGSPGTLHGSYSYVLQNGEGQIAETHSISAGLDYPGVGPQHSALFESGRVHYDAALDQEALEAFQLLCRSEGIIPALESSHALAYVVRVAKTFKKDACILINLSGRGDKDLPQLFEKGLIQ